MDKVSTHCTSKKVMKYFKDNKDKPISVYLPNESPGFMVIKKIWKIAKRGLLVLKYYSSFAELKDKMSRYFRIKIVHNL